jgi:hypothetical protein
VTDGVTNGEPILFAIYARKPDEGPLLSKTPTTDLLLGFDLLLPDLPEDHTIEIAGDAYFKFPLATETQPGVLCLATADEATNGSNGEKAITPATLKRAHSLASADGTNESAVIVDEGGNLGVGTTSPTQTLHVRGDSADNDGLTVENAGGGNPQLRFMVGGAEKAAITLMKAWEKDSYSGLAVSDGVENLINIREGNVGIGTSNPGSNKLKVEGNTAITGDLLSLKGDKPVLKIWGQRSDDNATIQLRETPEGKYGFDLKYIGIRDNKFYVESYNNGQSKGKHLTIVRDSGNVGIGTTNPDKAKLHVNGSVSRNISDYAFYERHSSPNVFGNYAEKVGVENGSATNNYSIYASNFVIGKGFHSFSDKRNKEVIEISNPENDLETLMKIEITDYTLKYPTDGDKKNKKVIGQQVRSVFPQAVNLSIDTVNDIMQKAFIDDTVVLLDNHGLQAGERINVVFEDDDSENVVEILTTSADSFTISESHQGGAFILGREVDDFHNVDYDAISMLTVSAVQALAEGAAKKQEEIDQLKSCVRSLEHEVQRIQSDQAVLTQQDAGRRPIEAALKGLRSAIFNGYRALADACSKGPATRQYASKAQSAAKAMGTAQPKS